MTTWTTLTPGPALRDELGLPDMALPVTTDHAEAFAADGIDIAVLADDIARFCVEQPDAAPALAEVGAFTAHMAAVRAGRAGDHESALYLTELGLRHRPENLSLAADRAAALIGLGRLDEAEAEVDRVITDPRVITAPGMWLVGARLAAARGDHARAAALLRDLAVDGVPPDEGFWDLLAAEERMAGQDDRPGSTVPRRSPGAPPPPAATATPVEGSAGSSGGWNAAVVALGLLLAGVGAVLALSGDEEGSAAPTTAVTPTTTAPTTTPPTTITSTTTTAPATTTTVASTTTVPTTTTSSSTTTSTSTTTTSTTTTSTTTTTAAPQTAPGAFSEDFDDGATAASALFGSEIMAFTVQEDGRGRIDGFSAGVLPVMYPGVYGEASSVFSFRPIPADPNSGFGMVLLSEDDGDGALDYYTIVWVVPADGSLGVGAFLDGEFQGVEFAPIPAEAGFDATDWNVLRVTVRDGGLIVSINGTESYRWSHPAMAAEGQIGYTLLSAVEGDTMLVDAFVVTP